MTDEILTEMHRIKDANGARHRSLQALVKSLGVRERESVKAGRRIISGPVRPRARITALSRTGR